MADKGRRGSGKWRQPLTNGGRGFRRILTLTDKGHMQHHIINGFHPHCLPKKKIILEYIIGYQDKLKLYIREISKKGNVMFQVFSIVSE